MTTTTQPAAGADDGGERALPLTHGSAAGRDR